MWQQHLGAKSLPLIAGVTFLLVAFIGTEILFLFSNNNDGIEKCQQHAIVAAIKLVKKHRENLCKRKRPDENDAVGENEHPRKKKYVQPMHHARLPWT